MWLNPLKNLYRCYVNIDAHDVSRVNMNYVLSSCLKELHYDLFGIVYGNFLKKYGNVDFKDLPIDVKNLITNFNKSYEATYNIIDNYKFPDELHYFSDFIVSLKSLLIFMYTNCGLNRG